LIAGPISRICLAIIDAPKFDDQRGNTGSSIPKPIESISMAISAIGTAQW
jgi:hypothetical protein